MMIIETYSNQHIFLSDYAKKCDVDANKKLRLIETLHLPFYSCLHLSSAALFFSHLPKPLHLYDFAVPPLFSDSTRIKLMIFRKEQGLDSFEIATRLFVWVGKVFLYLFQSSSSLFLRYFLLLLFKNFLALALIIGHVSNWNLWARSWDVSPGMWYCMPSN